MTASPMMERRLRSTNQKTAGVFISALAAAAGVMIAGVAGNTIGTYFNGAPHVGDIVSFAPGGIVGVTGTRLTVNREVGSGCVLDLDVIRRIGGSLVVETENVSDAGGFRVHWAGARTSGDGGNCGSDVGLIIGRGDLDVLASSAGGYGTGRDRVRAFSLKVGR